MKKLLILSLLLVVMLLSERIVCRRVNHKTEEKDTQETKVPEATEGEPEEGTFHEDKDGVKVDGKWKRKRWDKPGNKGQWEKREENLIYKDKKGNKIGDGVAKSESYSSFQEWSSDGSKGKKNTSDNIPDVDDLLNDAFDDEDSFKFRRRARRNRYHRSN